MGKHTKKALNNIKNRLSGLKLSVLENLERNIKDQCSEDSAFYLWSGLDLADKSVSLDERLKKLEDLIETFCNGEVITVSKYLDNKETSLVPDQWNGFNGKITYQAKINTTENDMKEEFKNAWPSINKLWHKSVNKSERSQLKLWKDFLQSYAIQFPSFSQLIQIMIATFLNTSVVERGYTQLEMIASKRRNHLSPENIETLFLLSALKIPVKKALDYGLAVEYLEK